MMYVVCGGVLGCIKVCSGFRVYSRVLVMSSHVFGYVVVY